MKMLSEKVAVAAGASRGAGRGIALALGGGRTIPRFDPRAPLQDFPC